MAIPSNSSSKLQEVLKKKNLHNWNLHAVSTKNCIICVLNKCSVNKYKVKKYVHKIKITHMLFSDKALY